MAGLISVLHFDVISAEITDAGHGPVLRLTTRLTGGGMDKTRVFTYPAPPDAVERLVASCNVPVQGDGDA